LDGSDGIGRLLIIAGVALALVGVLIVLAPQLPIIGRLPGTINIETENVHIVIPLGAMLVVSVVLTIVLNLLGRR
jgi:hypothetical protein